MAFMRAFVAGSSASRDPRPLEPFELSWGLVGGGAVTRFVVVVLPAAAGCIWLLRAGCWAAFEASGGSLAE
jgi:hypothetical protein